MKKTLITLLALAGVSFGDAISGTDAKTAIGNALTLNNYKAGDIFTVELELHVKEHMDSNTGFLQFASDGWIINQLHRYWGINTSDGNSVAAADPDNYTKVIDPTNSDLYTYTSSTIKGLWAQNADLTGSTERAALWDNDDNLGITISYDGKKSFVSLTYDESSSIVDTWVFTDVILNAKDIVLDSNLSVVSHSVSVTNVPEPTTATLSLLALAGLAARRRRK